MYKDSFVRWQDDRRILVVPGNGEEAITFAVENWIQSAQMAVQDHGFFAVALSGGSTPKAIFEKLAQPHYVSRVDWSKVKLFWSDERCVSPDHPDSNYHMAMHSGLAKMPIKEEHIFRMQGEKQNKAEAAKEYEQILLRELHEKKFDLNMLGMGDDGHTASLFPHTEGLNKKNCLVCANFVPQKDCWRLSLTFDGIHATRDLVVYVIGKSKAPMLKNIFMPTDVPSESFPAQKIGSVQTPVLWIADTDAAEQIRGSI